MGGFFRFVDEDWSWNTSLTVIVFDLLVDRVPDGPRKAEIAGLRDENLLMLDLRDPSQDDLVEIVVDDLKGYLANRFNPVMWNSLEPGISQLLRLATPSAPSQSSVAEGWTAGARNDAG